MTVEIENNDTPVLSEADKATKEMDEALFGIKPEEPEKTGPEAGTQGSEPTKGDDNDKGKAGDASAATDDKGNKEETPGSTASIDDNGKPKLDSEGNPIKDDAGEKPKLLAGKYTNEFDLQGAVLHELSTLKRDKKDAIALFREASKSGDYSKVESLYKELQADAEKVIAEQKKNDNAKPGSEETPPEPSGADAGGTEELTVEQTNAIIVEEAQRSMLESPIVAKMKAKGVALPTSKEELEELEDAYPALFMQYTQTWQAILHEKQQAAEIFMQTEKAAPTHNNSQIDKTKESIRNFGKDYEVDFTEDEVKAFIDESLKLDHIYENKNNVPYIRDGILYDLFVGKHAKDVIDRMKVNHQKELDQLKVDTTNSTAKKVHEKLVEKDKKAIKSISTGDQSGDEPRQIQKVDWNNKDEVKKAGEEQAKKELDEILSRPN